jgi:hypothetical protein
MILDFDRIYHGTEVAQYMKDITPLEENKPTYYANMIRGSYFQLTEIPLKEVLDILKDDPGIMDYLEWYNPRYYGSDFDGFYTHDDDSPADIEEQDLYNPIVIFDGILLDGYSRLSEHLHNSNKTSILAFISV